MSQGRVHARVLLALIRSQTAEHLWFMPLVVHCMVLLMLLRLVPWLPARGHAQSVVSSTDAQTNTSCMLLCD